VPVNEFQKSVSVRGSNDKNLLAHFWITMCNRCPFVFCCRQNAFRFRKGPL